MRAQAAAASGAHVVDPTTAGGNRGQSRVPASCFSSCSKSFKCKGRAARCAAFKGFALPPGKPEPGARRPLLPRVFGVDSKPISFRGGAFRRARADTRVGCCGSTAVFAALLLQELATFFAFLAAFPQAASAPSAHAAAPATAPAGVLSFAFSRLSASSSSRNLSSSAEGGASGAGAGGLSCAACCARFESWKARKAASSSAEAWPVLVPFV
mmetsp:Transcript_8547/g.24306  ORF Transcript_8547/g.24306 Transcript_8547/m.24306 type:complete len:212 (-) Transcript_8547:1426-2061(-)